MKLHLLVIRSSLFFKGPPLDLNQKAIFQNLFLKNQLCKLFWIENKKQKKSLLKLMTLSESERFKNQVLHTEFYSAIRLDIGWNSTCHLGIPPGSLGIEKPLRFFFSAFKNWSLINVLNNLGISYLLGFRAAYLPVVFSPDIGVITLIKYSPENLLEVGMKFQRLWLIATSMGKAIQPIPSSAFYSLEGFDKEGIPKSLQLKLSKGWKKILPHPTDLPILIFRIGHAKPLPIHSSRRPIEEYMI